MTYNLSQIMLNSAKNAAIYNKNLSGQVII